MRERERFLRRFSSCCCGGGGGGGDTPENYFDSRPSFDKLSRISRHVMIKQESINLTVISRITYNIITVISITMIIAFKKYIWRKVCKGSLPISFVTAVILWTFDRGVTVFNVCLKSTEINWPIIASLVCSERLRLHNPGERGYWVFGTRDQAANLWTKVRILSSKSHKTIGNQLIDTNIGLGTRRLRSHTFLYPKTYAWSCDGSTNAYRSEGERW